MVGVLIPVGVVGVLMPVDGVLIVGTWIFGVVGVVNWVFGVVGVLIVGWLLMPVEPVPNDFGIVGVLILVGVLIVGVLGTPLMVLGKVGLVKVVGWVFKGVPKLLVGIVWKFLIGVNVVL